MISLPLPHYISLPLNEFWAISGLGNTLVREMIKDGRLQSVRVGKKRLLIVVKSYLDFIEKQQVEGVPEYERTQPAIEARKQKLEARRKDTRTPPKVDLHDLELL